MKAEQRKQLVILAASTVAVVFFIWMFVVRAQQEARRAKQLKIDELHEKVEVARRGVRLAEKMKNDLEISVARLAAIETSMAEGDLYRWVINAMRGYQSGFGIEITDFDPPEVSDPEDLPRVPYKAAAFSVIGTGRYHDFGRFLAELENDMPFLRLKRLEISSSAGPVEAAGAREVLTFHMRFQTLVRTPAESAR